MFINFKGSFILFVVNMRIVGADENLKPLTGKVKQRYCY